MKLLAFLSGRLGFLKRAPLLPHLLDALLTFHTLLLRPGVARAGDALDRAVRAWPGASWRPHPFGGREWTWQNREIGHLHGNGVLDIPLGKREKSQALIAAKQAQEHHTHPGTGWISFSLASPADVAPALALLRARYDELRGRET